MRSPTRLYGKIRLLLPFFAVLLLLLTRAPAGAGEAPANTLPPAGAPAAMIDLDTARHIALEKQPALAAYRASLAAAQAKVQALDNLCVPTFLRPDLPVRRCQAHIGLSIAQAQLVQQEWETLYAVTRTYLTALYANEQRKESQHLLRVLTELQATTKGLAGEKGSNVTVLQSARVQAMLEMINGRQQESVSGVERAKAALREAMGVGPDFPLDLPNDQLRAEPV